jgi:hypothetical protein
MPLPWPAFPMTTVPAASRPALAYVVDHSSRPVARSNARSVPVWLRAASTPPLVTTGASSSPTAPSLAVQRTAPVAGSSETSAGADEPVPSAAMSDPGQDHRPSTVPRPGFFAVPNSLCHTGCPSLSRSA